MRGAVSDDESLRDAEALASVLGSSLNLLLHGHTHDSKLTWLGETPLPVLSTGSAALKPDARPPEVPNQYQILRIGPRYIQRWTRRLDAGGRRWTGDTSCSADGNDWRVMHALSFVGVEAAFTDPPDTTDVQDGDSGADGPREGGRDDLLSRVHEICRLRYGGDATQIEAVHHAVHPYLRVRTRERAIAKSFPVGVVDGNLTADTISQFCQGVFERFYWALDPNLRCTIVYSGAHASDELLRVAATRNVLLRSFVEFQGIIDFRGYLRRQKDRLEQNAVYPPELYVPQRLEFEVGTERRLAPDAISEMFTWLREPRARFVLVLGDFGTGKTFLLRELARQMRTAIPHLVPVLVELRALEKARTLEQLIAQHLATAGERFIDLEAFPYMLREGRIVLLFDGFDELAQRVTYRRATEHFETLLQAAGGDAKVVVTSRTQHFESDRQVRTALMDRAELLAGLSICRLQPFDESQIRAFLTRRLGGPEAAHDQYALISEINDLLGLSHNPRMLGFIAAIPEDRLREARERTGTITAADLYRLLIEQWLDLEWDKTQPRGAAPGLSKDHRWRAVTALARSLWRKLERTVHVDELAEEVSLAVQHLGPEPEDGTTLDPDAMAHIVGSRTLLVRDEQGAFAFVHSSVMEWLVAHDIATHLAASDVATALMEREMTALMTEFVCDLSPSDALRAWSQRAISTEERSPARANALAILDRLGEAVRGASLAGARLSGRDLSRHDLRDAELSRADLTEATLRHADLRCADLTGATLARADLNHAVLSGAALDRVQAPGIQLLGADLRKATFDGANLRRAKLTGAILGSDELLGADTFGAALPLDHHVSPMLALPASSARGVAVSHLGDLIVSAHEDGSVRVWDAISSRPIRVLLGCDGAATAVALSPDGTMVVAGDESGRVHLWDTQRGEPTATVRAHWVPTTAVSFAPDGASVASGGADGRTRVVELATRRVVSGSKAHAGGVNALAYAPDGGALASAGDDGRVFVHPLRPRGRSVLGLQDGVALRTIAYSPDGLSMATAGSDGAIRIWSSDTGSVKVVLPATVGGVETLAYSPDGLGLVAAGSAGIVNLWTLGSDRPPLAISDGTEAVTGVAFSGNGHTLAIARSGGGIDVSDGGGRGTGRLTSITGSVHSVAFGPDSRIMATAGSHGVRLWNLSTLTELARLNGQVTTFGVAFAPDGDSVAIADERHTVQIWNWTTGRLLHTLYGHGDWVRGAAYSPDGRVLASAGDDGTVRLWDPLDERKLHVLQNHWDWVHSVVFAPDGDSLASAGRDGSVRVWDRARGKELQSWAGPEDGILSIAYSPDARLIAIGGANGRVRLWNPSLNDATLANNMHEAGVRALAFSPGGGLLATGCENGRLQVWAKGERLPRRTVQAHIGGVTCVRFTPDGHLLATTGTDGRVCIWNAARGRLLATIADLAEGYVAFAPDGRYKTSGRVGGAFWYTIGLCRFGPGEADAFLTKGTLRGVGARASLLRRPRSAAP